MLYPLRTDSRCGNDNPMGKETQRMLRIELFCKTSKSQLRVEETAHRISEGPLSTVLTHHSTNPVFVFAGIHFVFIFMQFSGKMGHMIGWISHIIGLGCPRQRNPGSATILGARHWHINGDRQIYVPDPISSIFFIFIQKNWPK